MPSTPPVSLRGSPRPADHSAGLPLPPPMLEAGSARPASPTGLRTRRADSPRPVASATAIGARNPDSFDQSMAQMPRELRQRTQVNWDAASRYADPANSPPPDLSARLTQRMAEADALISAAQQYRESLASVQTVLELHSEAAALRTAPSAAMSSEDQRFVQVARDLHARRRADMQAQARSVWAPPLAFQAAGEDVANDQQSPGEAMANQVIQRAQERGRPLTNAYQDVMRQTPNPDADRNAAALAAVTTRGPDLEQVTAPPPLHDFGNDVLPVQAQGATASAAAERAIIALMAQRNAIAGLEPGPAAAGPTRGQRRVQTIERNLLVRGERPELAGMATPAMREARHRITQDALAMLREQTPPGPENRVLFDVTSRVATLLAHAEEDLPLAIDHPFGIDVPQTLVADYANQLLVLAGFEHSIAVPGRTTNLPPVSATLPRHDQAVNGRAAAQRAVTMLREQAHDIARLEPGPVLGPTQGQVRVQTIERNLRARGQIEAAPGVATQAMRDTLSGLIDDAREMINQQIGPMEPNGGVICDITTRLGTYLYNVEQNLPFSADHPLGDDVNRIHVADVANALLELAGFEERVTPYILLDPRDDYDPAEATTTQTTTPPTNPPRAE
jgi:hypothetical protein